MEFLVASIVVINGIAVLMPKRIPKWEFYVTAWFALFFELITNVYIDLKYDLYGYFDKGPSWATILVMFGLYPAGNAIIINFYPYTRTWISKMVFVLATDAICSVYEVLATRTTFFYYNGWRWWYSALAYLVIVPILITNRNITRALVERDEKD
ncbi:CBO0543 family protein [Alicyclobacillus fastidiosus]|uniref:CBO0543 family protein n=1 Tax=Alicyclobacillus fastidiosus TaxID=392011 RepID=A0ABV5AIK9_9BACL|nr:CBO0543 family protein [Alicyclobacillus fastidiosus]WEH11104.1 hypothetical protein PYS47_07770 [Alicyclobacillus fastidiosus]